MTAHQFLSEHGYLVSAILGLPGVMTCLWLAGVHRSSVFAAGLIETLHVAPLIWFDGVYWTPRRLGGWALGIEDVLVCFSLGVGVWFVAMYPVRSRLVTDLRLLPVVTRLIRVAVPTTALAALVWGVGAGVMETLLITMAATGIVLAALWPERLMLSASVVLFYPPYYVVVLLIAAQVSEGFTGIWNGAQLSGLRLLGLPLEEYAFVYAFSAVYPLIIGYAFNARDGATRQVD